MTSIIDEIKTLVKKGDSDCGRAEKYYKAAGLRLIKLRVGKTKVEFEKLAGECSIKSNRAYFFMKLARGDTTLTRDRAQTAKRVRKLRKKKRALRNAQKPELAEEDLPGDTPEQRWHYSVGNMAGEAISLQAFWDRTFGEEWKSFEASSDLVTLAQQAADAWTQIANELTTRAGAIPIRRTSYGS